jgi:hypothetical protein
MTFLFPLSESILRKKTSVYKMKTNKTPNNKRLVNRGYIRNEGCEFPSK